MLEQIRDLLVQNGEMVFSAYVSAAYAAGVRQPQMWLRAKHAGLVETEIRDGVLYIRAAPAPEPEPAP